MVPFHRPTWPSPTSLSTPRGASSQTAPMRIVAYFVFQEAGVAIGLQGGDVLIFNPHTYHCCSLHVSTAEMSVACPLRSPYTYYTKAAAIGLNNNRIPLAAVEAHECAEVCLCRK